MDSLWQGLTPYDEGLKIQSQMFEKTREDGKSRIIGLEHPTVITLGKRGSQEADVQDPSHQAQVFQIDRGGQATLHSPGQLVIYPIVHLQKKNIGVRDFVHALEEATIQTLNEIGIQSQRGEASGVFTNKGKIAFVGIRVDRGVTRHGISINISNDMNLFHLIRPCGVNQQPLDRLANYNDQMTTHDFFQKWIRIFTSVF
ncbi:MAG: hypothetical protein BroJett041_23730 [Candidatus Jettenia caeni]|nr:MAG: hypothetical protein BroJett041_23730 [Candidatus Jettenia caeni]